MENIESLLKSEPYVDATGVTVESAPRRALHPASHPALYASGGVPVPIIAMQLDDRLSGGEELACTRNNKIYRHRVDGDGLARARGLIRRAVALPDIAEVTEYAAPSRMTYVELLGSNGNI